MSTVFSTIITADHIQYALALRKSILDFGKDIFFHILVVDKTKGLKVQIENNYSNTSICYAEDICIDGIAKSIFSRYYHSDMDAFRWSMKPVFIKYLLLEKNYGKVIYTDCDIHFYSDYHFLLDELDMYNVLITPHWRSSNPNVDLPNFEMLYTNGIYNGGFIGANKKAIAVMEWWAMACEYRCIKDPINGMFVDQAYLNLLPVYFEKVGIVKHKGCNVANWNMIECKRSLSPDQKTVLIADQYQIVFIHFTKSTINGIISGNDALLNSYLQQYYNDINQYVIIMKLPEISIYGSKWREEQHSIQKIKTIVKKALGW